MTNIILHLRISRLEVALFEYIQKYGMSEKARELFIQDSEFASSAESLNHLDPKQSKNGSES